MASLDEIVSLLDDELRLHEVPDYPGALNGLQMVGRPEVKQVAAAVDASLPVVQKAVKAGVDLLHNLSKYFYHVAHPLHRSEVGHVHDSAVALSEIRTVALGFLLEVVQVYEIIDYFQRRPDIKFG